MIRMNFIAAAFSILAVTLVIGSASCSDTPFGAGSKDNPPINGKTLTTEMSDAEMLAVFGVDPSKAKKTVARGPDGYSTGYVQGDQKVHITRSVVTGIYVMSSGPIEGEWKVGTR